MMSYMSYIVICVIRVTKLHCSKEFVTYNFVTDITGLSGGLHG